MEEERYKMIYTKYLSILFENDDIRILGNDFVKNNKNKRKLNINNKKYKLKEFINVKEFFKNDIIKINMILIKELSNISHLFEICKNKRILFFR